MQVLKSPRSGEIADMARVRANQAVVGDSYDRPQSHWNLSRGRLCLGLWVYVYQRGVQYEYLLESIVSPGPSKIATECGELMSLAAWPCFGCAFRRISSLSAQSVRISSRVEIVAVTSTCMELTYSQVSLRQGDLVLFVLAKYRDILSRCCARNQEEWVAYLT